MKDPVTGFTYPAEWVQNCAEQEHRDLVKSGRAVLTSSGRILMRGYTTGTTAAAVAKAAVLSLRHDVSSVRVTLPCEQVVDVAVNGKNGIASGIKYSGDYPSDITAGLEFMAEATVSPASITILFGEGIGRFVRDTPRYAKNSPAVSPTALSGIVRAVQEALDMTGATGISVRISAPGGIAIGPRTLNPKMGVDGGISVLGTTGFVEPWDDHLTESTMERIAAAAHPVLTTGRTGLRFSRLLFPDREVILVGGKIGEALAAARGDVTLCGLPALILRFIRPEILDGTGFATVEEFSASGGFQKAVPAILASFRERYPRATVVLINREGRIIGESP